MLSFGISHNPMRATQVTKKQNGRNFDGVKIGFSAFSTLQDFDISSKFTFQISNILFESIHA
jgi:hypothetical protein